MLPAHPSVPGLIDYALLIVSELVTNAVRNGCKSGTLYWTVDDDCFLTRTPGPVDPSAEPRDFDASQLGEAQVAALTPH